jgi:hypothetical protein
MESGKISGNNASFNSGGGVNIASTYDYTGGMFVAVGGGTFTMNGGEISGNIASEGGGVSNSGTFIMQGGKISGNTASEGGGVYDDRNFLIVTGTIYGSNEATTSLRNTATNETAALSGRASYGQLLKNGSWYENGTLSSTDNTIRVVNGVLQ